MTIIADLYSRLHESGNNPVAVTGLAGGDVSIVAADLYAAMIPVVSPVPAPPCAPAIYMSQWKPGDSDRRVNDCGETCGAMFLRVKGDNTPINSLTVANPTGLSDAAELQALLKAHGMSSVIEQSSPALPLEQAVKPYTMLLINYTPIARFAQDVRFAGWHWLVYVGPDPANAANSLTLDPDYWGSRINEGDHKSYPTSALRSAFRPYSGATCTALYVTDEPVVPPTFAPHNVTVNTGADSLRVRGGPGTTYPTLRTLKNGAVVRVIAQTGGWFRLDSVTVEWISAAYTKPMSTPVDIPPAPTAPPVVVSPPSPTALVLSHAIGIHAHYNADATMILAMVDRLLAVGKRFACVTVISNIDLANALAQRGITVMFRQVWDDRERYDPSMLDNLTPEQAEARGRAFYRGEHYPVHQRLDKRVILKFVNERGYHPLVGNDFWIGLMKAADEDGRKLAIFGDSVGSPEVADYARRVPALRYATTHGHVVTLNEYGRFDDLPNGQRVEGDHPVSDDEAYQYYGGRHELFYDAVPEDCRPPLIIGETGPSHSSVTHDEAFIINDARKYSAKLKAGKYGALVVGYSYYTFGKWKNCSLDAYAGAFERLVMQS